MKKLSLLIATILVFALTITSFAGSFSDLPVNHWAYEAVNELAAADIIEGFPDGTFRPDESMTRSQMALVVSRVLVKINEASQDSELNEEINSIEDEIDKLSSGLTTEQAQDVEAICEVLINKNKSGDSSDLSDKQASQVVDLVQKLTKEFEQEIKVLRTKLQAAKNVDKMRYNSVKSNVEDVKGEIDKIKEEMNDTDISLQAQENIGAMRYEHLVDQINSKYEELKNQVTENSEELKDQSVDIAALKNVGAMRYNNLSSRIKGSNDRISDLENRTVQFKTPTYDVKFKDVSVKGPGAGSPWLDPYLKDLNDDGNADAGDQFDPADEYFRQKLGMGLKVEKGALKADLSLDAVKEDFVSGAETGFTVSDLKGTIEVGDFFKATVNNGQKPSIRDYLFGGDDSVNGVVATVNGKPFVLVEGATDAFGSEFSQDFMGTTFNVAYGFEDLVDGRNLVLGVDTELDVAGFKVVPEFAVSDKKFQKTLMRLSASGDVGPVTTSFEYAKDSLDPIVASKYSVDDGYGINGKMDLLNLDVTYENYFSAPAFRVDASKTFAGIENSFSFDQFTEANENRMQYEASYTQDMGNLELTGIFNWIAFSNTANYEAEQQKYGGGYNAAGDTLDKTLEASYAIGEAITTGATLTHDINGDLYQKFTAGYAPTDGMFSADATIEKPAAPGATYEQAYSADFTKDMLSAGVTKYINKKSDATILTAAVNADQSNAYSVRAVEFKPYAEFAYQMAGGTNLTQYAAGLDADRSLSDKATLTGGLEYADKDKGFEDGDVDLGGSKVTKSIGLNYEISENVSADLKYETLNFIGDNAADSYVSEVATGALSVSF